MTHTEAHEPRAVSVQIQGENLDRNFMLRCRNAADERLLTGWAKADNDVSLHLQGLGYQVDAFLNWLRAGVDGSRIGRISVSPSERQEWSDFEIFD